MKTHWTPYSEVERHNVMLGWSPPTSSSQPQTARALALRQGYILDVELHGTEEIKSWEKDWLQKMADFPMPPRYNLYRQNMRSYDDELLRSVQGDIMLNAFCYSLMICYCWWLLNRNGSEELLLQKVSDPAERRRLSWKLWRIGNRYGVAMQGVLVVMMSTLAGYGFCLYLGIKFNSTLQILPFILLGIGVDGRLVWRGAAGSIGGIFCRG